MLARPPRFPGRHVDPPRDFIGAIGRSAIVANGDIVEFDLGGKAPAHRIALGNLDPARGFLREELTVRRIDAAAADFVGAEQDIADAAFAALLAQGEPDIFEVGAGGREDDVDAVAEAIGLSLIHI